MFSVRQQLLVSGPQRTFLGSVEVCAESSRIVGEKMRDEKSRERKRVEAIRTVIDGSLKKLFLHATDSCSKREQEEVQSCRVPTFLNSLSISTCHK